MSTIDARSIERPWVDGLTGRVRAVLFPGVILLVLLAVWEFGVYIFAIPVYVLPPPSAVAIALVSHHPIIAGALGTTITVFLIAFGFTLITGYGLALVMYEWKSLETTLYPYVISARAIPIIALLPIFVIWFGFGFRSIVSISYLISLFAMVVNALAGFKSTDPAHIEMLESFSADRWQLFREIHLYSSLPLVLAGAKICVILAFTGVIVGEFLIGTEGVGFLILEYKNSLETAKMFAAIVAVSITQLALFGAVVMLERLLVTWR